MSFKIESLPRDSYETLAPFVYDYHGTYSCKTDILPPNKVASYNVQPSILRKHHDKKITHVVDFANRTSSLCTSAEASPSSEESVYIVDFASRTSYRLPSSIPSPSRARRPALPSPISITNALPRILKVPSNRTFRIIDLLHHYNARPNLQNVDWGKVSRDTNSKLLSLLYMIEDSKINPFENDFVCMRNDLKTLMSTPYFGTDRKWRIGASKFKNTIFLTCFFDTKKKESEYMTPEDKKKMDYCQYSLKHSFTTAHDDYENQNNNQNYKNPPDVDPKTFMGVFQTDLRKIEIGIGRDNFSSLKLLYAGDLDAYSTDSNDLRNYSMIRATGCRKSFQISDANYYNYLDQTEIFDWWSTGMLSGVPKIHLAKLNEHYGVSEYEELYISTIPRLTESQNWKGLKTLDITATDYLYKTMEYIRKTMRNETNPRNVYMFENHQNVKGWKITEDFNMSRILPDWFIDAFNNFTPLDIELNSLNVVD